MLGPFTRRCSRIAIPGDTCKVVFADALRPARTSAPITMYGLAVASGARSSELNAFALRAGSRSGEGQMRIARFPVLDAELA